ncbi:hypothetical protein [Tenacibaculum dicentrarchi]|uniref:hypothetical protein n=1 Tax=Tenacibaculum dicentrarchi TaxID=669041 RepID=UPI000C7BE5CA|nr:hypothetical protein TDCHD05_210002 [Tenacibaculum dicentrarchi]
MSNFDFHLDLKNEISEILNNSGINISLEQNIQKILMDFFNLKSKILEPKKRNVFIVPNFKEIIKKHHKNLEIQTIIKYAEAGENLNCFQTVKIIQSKQIDHLSNEWNIFHFHLSLKPDRKPKFIKRGNLLLFAYIDNENIIFLGVDKHKNSFSNIKWLEILEKNYPQFLNKYLAPDLPTVQQNFTTSEREEIWENGISSGFMNINGKTYLCPGIGKATNGYNIQVVTKSNNILHWISRIEDIISKNEHFKNIETILKLKISEKSMEIFENEKGNIIFEYPSLEIKK